MKQIKIEVNIDFLSLEELSEDELQLVYQAAEATKNAYAKYSRFYVGAAARLANGQVFIGANQENAAFPSGLCAERTAIFAAQANCPDQPVEMLAIAARNDIGLLEQPVTPCGACRQVILEIEDRYRQPIEILLYGRVGVYKIKSIKDLLPLSFVDANMR
ncbi:MAG: cytidine deaminase [Bacteroidota bacterium]|nr:cytidine deaminase [Prevotella sp.]MDD3386940.1 cytidine deaminase [Prevotella sp.]MDT3386431.1 cytidine deaminase [Bacteroidota bacterium]